MLILVANLGSTSFKHKLFRLDPAAPGSPEAPRLVASGSSQRIGQDEPGDWESTFGDIKASGTAPFRDHAAAIELHLNQLKELTAIESWDDIDAVGFKAVHGGPISGAVPVDDDVLATMERFTDAAPAHNPPYIAAMRAFEAKLPNAQRVACFETAYHQSIPLARQAYGIPHQWMEEYGIRRYGFHGASHRYIATRMRKLAPKVNRIISLHLGGSSSLCAIDSGDSVANSFGYTPQSGIFANNRVGDFDTFAIPRLRAAGLTDDDIFAGLSTDGGLLGLSGVSADLRDVEAAASQGNQKAKLAIAALVEHIRHHLGGQLIALGGLDALCFTGGIGQHSSLIRREVCRDLDFINVNIDNDKNNAADPKKETRIDGGGVQIWVLPTDEELIVARQTAREIMNRRDAETDRVHRENKS